MCTKADVYPAGPVSEIHKELVRYGLIQLYKSLCLLFIKSCFDDQDETGLQ